MSNKYEILKAIVNSHYIDMEVNQKNNNSDLILILSDTFMFLERQVQFLKRILKEEDCSKFKGIKQAVII